MTQRDVIVRCPGCGNGKVIALAVGQLLQCDVCRTNFQAPLSDDAGSASESTAATPGGASALGDISHPASSAAADPLSAPSDDFHAPESDGDQRTRTWNHGVPEEVTGAAATPAPSAPNEALSERHAAGTSSLLWSIVTVLAAGVILATLGAALLVLVRHFPRSPDHSTAAKTVGQPEPINVTWTDASQYSQRHAPITVKVERAVYGSLRVKDRSHQVITTEDDNLLGLTLSALNQGRSARPFQNWYGHVFVDGRGHEQLAELTDNHGRDYALLKFDDVTYVEGQRLADQIAPNQSVRDTVVFLIPEETDLASIEFFRLSLPGAAVGVRGFFRFEIPRSMISGLDARGAPSGQPAGSARP